MLTAETHLALLGVRTTGNGTLGFFYESKVRMQGMSEELVLQLMPLHPSAQQNEAYSYATKGSGANAEFCCSGAKCYEHLANTSVSDV